MNLINLCMMLSFNQIQPIFIYDIFAEIQSQLFNCQDLLTKYQDKINRKQQELNDSFSEHSKTKVRS